MSITSLKIIGIGFHGCGSPIPRSYYNEANKRQTEMYYYYFEGIKAALFLVNVFDLLINHIHVNDSDGYGLFIINALGTSSISNSLFSYNNYRALQHHQYNPAYCDAVYTPKTLQRAQEVIWWFYFKTRYSVTRPWRATVSVYHIVHSAMALTLIMRTGIVLLTMCTMLVD